MNSTECLNVMLDRIAADITDASYQRCPAHVTALLLKIFDLGLSCASRDELEDLLACIDVLCEEWPPVCLAAVRLHIRYADWIGAVRLLKRLEAAQTLNPTSLALMAGCLFKLDDPDWQRYAATLTRGEPNPRAETILLTFVRGAATVQGVGARPGSAPQVGGRTVLPISGTKTLY